MSKKVTTNQRSLALAVITTAVLSYAGYANAQTKPKEPTNGTYVGNVEKTAKIPKAKKLQAHPSRANF